MQRIGVFVCHCGSNIAATVDVKKVVELAAKEPGVVHAEDYQYMCSEAGQAKIQEAIREKNLTGVVVCSCSPLAGRLLCRRISLDGRYRSQRKPPEDGEQQLGRND